MSSFQVVVVVVFFFQTNEKSTKRTLVALYPASGQPALGSLDCPVWFLTDQDNWSPDLMKQAQEADLLSYDIKDNYPLLFSNNRKISVPEHSYLISQIL